MAERDREAKHERDLLNFCLSVLDEHGEAFDPKCPPGVPAIARIVNGGAMGADMFADNWGRHWGRAVERFVPDWNEHGAAAGPIRNQRMLERLVQLRDAGETVAALLMPGGRGTDDMRRRLDKAGITIYTVNSFDSLGCPCHTKP